MPLPLELRRHFAIARNQCLDFETMSRIQFLHIHDLSRIYQPSAKRKKVHNNNNNKVNATPYNQQQIGLRVVLEEKPWCHQNQQDASWNLPIKSYLVQKDYILDLNVAQEHMSWIISRLSFRNLKWEFLPCVHLNQ